MRRFFTTLADVDSLPCEQTLSDPFVVEHLTRVLRFKQGDECLLIDSQRQQAYRAEYLDDSVRIRLVEKLELPKSSAPEIILGAVILKEQKWDWLLQKATELGVSQIIPLMSQHGVVEITSQKAAAKHNRWQEIVRSAAQQSEQSLLPEVQSPKALTAWLNTVPDALKLLLLERGNDRQTLKQALSDRSQPVLLLVGPEGGWHIAEIEQLIAAGFKPVSLGDRILRSETAAIAAISMVLYDYAD